MASGMAVYCCAAPKKIPNNIFFISSHMFQLNSFGVVSGKLSVVGGVTQTDLFGELLARSVATRHIRWLGISVLAWTLWMIRHNQVIRHSLLRRSCDAIYKMCGILQPWKPLSRD